MLLSYLFRVVDLFQFTPLFLLIECLEVHRIFNFNYITCIICNIISLYSTWNPIYVIHYFFFPLI
ncbi:hypothetical protein BDB01DRAFT_769399 [Pilobolus umbonatus]|nr:hypothetical protein BDB01DRAFT_769399 [Pilobolus umbonatus]